MWCSVLMERSNKETNLIVPRFMETDSGFLRLPGWGMLSVSDGTTGGQTLPHNQTCLGNCSKWKPEWGETSQTEVFRYSKVPNYSFQAVIICCLIRYYFGINLHKFISVFINSTKLGGKTLSVCESSCTLNFWASVCVLCRPAAGRSCTGGLRPVGWLWLRCREVWSGIGSFFHAQFGDWGIPPVFAVSMLDPDRISDPIMDHLPSCLL